MHQYSTDSRCQNTEQMELINKYWQHIELWKSWRELFELQDADLHIASWKQIWIQDSLNETNLMKLNLRKTGFDTKFADESPAFICREYLQSHPTCVSTGVRDSKTAGGGCHAPTFRARMTLNNAYDRDLKDNCWCKFYRYRFHMHMPVAIYQ